MSVTVNQFKEMLLTSSIDPMLSAEMVPIKLKIWKKWDEETLNDLMNLVNELEVPLHLSKIETGCIAVTWRLCPTADVKDLKKVIIKSADSLQKKGVLQIFIGGDPVWKSKQAGGEDLVWEPKQAGDKLE